MGVSGTRVYVWRLRSGVGGEIGEPLSWVLGVLAISVAWIGFRGLLQPTQPYVLWSLAGILVGFIVHEALHKYTARRYGMLSEFVASPIWLLITVVSSFLWFKILAPGYVRVIAVFRGHTRKELFMSTVVGPASNIVIALVTLPLASINPGFSVVSQINGWLAMFNLLPIPPLDGSKVLSYDMRIWAMLFAVSFLILMLA